MYVYVPILIYWGLPLSLLGIIGAIVFSPVLAGYLILSSILFFTQIFGIPNDWCAYILEWVSTAWLTILSLGKDIPTIGFVCPSSPVLFLIPLAGFLIFWFIRKNSELTRTLWLAGVMAVILLLLKLCLTPVNSASILYRSERVNTQYQNNKLTVTIPHVKTTKKQFLRWWHRDFYSWLYKNFGTTAVDNIVLEHHTKPLEAAVQEITKQ